MHDLYTVTDSNLPPGLGLVAINDSIELTKHRQAHNVHIGQPNIRRVVPDIIGLFNV